MSVHFQKELDHLKNRALGLCALVEKNVALAARAIAERDVDLAGRVLVGDAEIDGAEVEIEEEALKILALNQPVATDLRFIVAVIKINNDLERIGDLAVNIASRAILLAGEDRSDQHVDFSEMCDKVIAMLRQSLDSLVNWDADLARRVCAADDEIDAMNLATYERLKQSANKAGGDIETIIHLLSVSRLLERIADHATNIAEDVIYLTRGEIVRHGVHPS